MPAQILSRTFGVSGFHFCDFQVSLYPLGTTSVFSRFIVSYNVIHIISASMTLHFQTKVSYGSLKDIIHDKLVKVFIIRSSGLDPSQTYLAVSVVQWLSRALYTRKVPGSSPGGNMYYLFQVTYREIRSTVLFNDSLFCLCHIIIRSRVNKDTYHQLRNS